MSSPGTLHSLKYMETKTIHNIPAVVSQGSICLTKLLWLSIHSSGNKPHCCWNKVISLHPVLSGNMCICTSDPWAPSIYFLSEMCSPLILPSKMLYCTLIEIGSSFANDDPVLTAKSFPCWQTYLCSLYSVVPICGNSHGSESLAGSSPTQPCWLIDSSLQPRSGDVCQTRQIEWVVFAPLCWLLHNVLDTWKADERVWFSMFTF